jgi:hypothetical protein
MSGGKKVGRQVLLVESQRNQAQDRTMLAFGLLADQTAG